MFAKYFLGIGIVLLVSLIQKPTRNHPELRSWYIDSQEEALQATFLKKEGHWVYLVDTRAIQTRIPIYQFQKADREYIEQRCSKRQVLLSKPRDKPRPGSLVPSQVYSWFWGLILLFSVAGMGYSFYHKLNAWLPLTLSSLSILALLSISLSGPSKPATLGYEKERPTEMPGSPTTASKLQNPELAEETEPLSQF